MPRTPRPATRELLPAGPPAIEPAHPGAILREDVLPAVKMSVSAMAVALKVSRQTLHAILAERAAVTPEMAARLGKFCGNGAGLWLRLQTNYDLWRVSRDMAAELADIPTVQAA